MDEQNNNTNKEIEEPAINVDEIYDGKLNQTIIIDPVSQKEVIVKNTRKPHIPFFSLILAILVLFIFFTYKKIDYIELINKYTNEILNKKDKEVTTKKATTIKSEIRTLSCTYQALYNGITINNTISIKETDDVITTNSHTYNYTLSDQTFINNYNTFLTYFDSIYEKLNNTRGLNVDYNKVTNGFSLKVVGFYDILDFGTTSATYENENEYKSSLTMIKTDTIDSLKLKYETIGYTCNLE